MATVKNIDEQYPHISFRQIPAEQEAFLPGTGLAVWEVAWIAEGYRGDVEATAKHLGIEHGLVREALGYTAEHVEEIGMQIHDHVCWEEADVRRAFPRARVVHFDPDSGDLLPSQALAGFLRDVHIPLAAMDALRRLSPDVQIEHVARWRGGAMRTATDEQVLVAAADAGLVVVTFDVHTIQTIANRWVAKGRTLPGVAFILGAANTTGSVAASPGL
jgi:hypothetical protein